jgi:hypothetical protein
LQACLSLIAIFVGVPEPPSISGARSGEWSKAVSITWSTLSYSPIFNYRLLYRKKEVRGVRIQEGKQTGVEDSKVGPKTGRHVLISIFLLKPCNIIIQ